MEKNRVANMLLALGALAVGISGTVFMARAEEGSGIEAIWALVSVMGYIALIVSFFREVEWTAHEIAASRTAAEQAALDREDREHQRRWRETDESWGIFAPVARFFGGS